jgi:RNA polymerase sigma-70 factor, ECF subfamily
MTGDDAYFIEFEAFFEKNYAGLVRYLQRMLKDSSRLAEDIAQDAFLITWRKWPEVRNHECPRAYLYTVARHLAIDAMKERSRVLLMDNLPETAVAGKEHPSDSWDTGMAVWEAIKKLPERQREAVLLFYMHDFPQGEIAKIMNITRGAVAALIHQARNRLAGLMGWSPGEGQIL